jgi:predicted acylesterase/phospholipase RssA
MLKSFAFISSALFGAVAAEYEKTDDRCRALVLSGGGSNGAWEAGVLYGLLHNGNPEDYAYDVVTGVSAGALNSLLFALTEPGTEKETTEIISDLWLGLKTKDVYKSGWLHTAEIIWAPSIYDDSPLLKYVKSVVKMYDGIKRRFAMGATDTNTGEYYVFNQYNTEFGDDLARAAVSSASIPFIFPPQVWRDRVLMDGGTVWNINIPSAI